MSARKPQQGPKKRIRLSVAFTLDPRVDAGLRARAKAEGRGLSELADVALAAMLGITLSEGSPAS